MRQRLETVVTGFRHAAVALVVTAGVLSIIASGSSGDDDGAVSTSSARISVESQSVFLDGSGDPFARLEGTAWVSSAWVAHNCVGLCCIICQFDDSYPGVDVTWHNQSNAAMGAATSHYGTLTNWEHRWSADVPIVAGMNTIVITAADPGGTSVSTPVNVQYLPTP